MIEGFNDRSYRLLKREGPLPPTPAEQIVTVSFRNLNFASRRDVAVIYEVLLFLPLVTSVRKYS